MTRQETMEARQEEIKSLYNELEDILAKYNKVRCNVVFEDFKVADESDCTYTDTYNDIYDEKAFFEAENDYIEDAVYTHIEKAIKLLSKFRRIYGCAMREVIKLESK